MTIQLSNDSLLQIENIIKSAKLVDISELLITKDLIRGINKSKTAFILSDLELQDDFKMIGINRPDIYISRYNLIKGFDDFKANATLKNNDDDAFVEQLDFKSKSVKVQYRCCSPSMISAPKSINDKVKYTIKFLESDVSILHKASTSIDTETIKINGSNEKLSYELIDLSGDTIKIDSENPPECKDDTFAFTYRFSQKPFLSLLKLCSDMEFFLGEKGILKIMVNNLAFYLLPQV